MRGWLALLLVVLAPRAIAHEVRPAYLELSERAPGEFDVVWKVPTAAGVPLAGEDPPHPAAEAAGPTRTMPCGCPAPTDARNAFGRLPIHPALPEHAVVVAPRRVERTFGAEIERWTIATGSRGLDGWRVAVHGLESTMIDVLVRVEMSDGRVVTRLLRPDAPSFAFSAAMAGPPAGGYVRLGVEHILFGVDHLLFVLALVLVVRGIGLLVKTITAFTVAHSVTLALATLGVVHVPSAPVEAVIALSIVFVAAEIARNRSGERGLTERAPWLVAGAFGLLHGFGFAGALSEVGLPANDVPLALLFFNLGVEAGQLAFVAATLVVLALLRRVRWPDWSSRVPAYAIGSIAACWFLQRTAAAW